MKSTFSTTILLLFSCILLGQTQPIEKIEVEKDPIIMDAYDYAVGRMNDVPWMFKATISDLVGVSFEHKLGKSFSINLNSTWIPISSANYDFGDFNNFKVGVRHYLNHRNRIILNKQGNNFNGSYFEGGLKISSIKENNFDPYFNLGFQSRFLKMGLIDAGIKISYGQRPYYINDDSNNTINIRSGFDIGFALSRKYELKRIDENRCAILKCYEEQSYMFRTRVNTLIGLSFNENLFTLNAKPNFEFEHKISKVGLSLNHEVHLDYTYRRYDEEIRGTDYESLEFGYLVSMKWFYLKNRMIAKGKTTNNLSGVYVGPTIEMGRIFWQINNALT